MTTVDQFLESWIRDRGNQPVIAPDPTMEVLRDRVAKARLTIRQEIHSALIAPSPQSGALTMLDVMMINCLVKSRGVPLEELALKYGLPVAEIERIVVAKLKKRKRLPGRTQDKAV